MRWSDYWIQSDSPLSAIKTQAIWNHNEVTQAATKPREGNYSVQILHGACMRRAPSRGSRAAAQGRERGLQAGEGGTEQLHGSLRRPR